MVLWFQQFCAMFLKRVYNTIRFWQAIFSQLILPLLFVLFALILAKTLPNANENDRSRALNVDNSGLDASNRLLFYAVFGENLSDIFNFDVSLFNSLLLHILRHLQLLCMYMYIYITFRGWTILEPPALSRTLI